MERCLTEKTIVKNKKKIATCRSLVSNESVIALSMTGMARKTVKCIDLVTYSLFINPYITGEKISKAPKIIAKKPPAIPKEMNC